MGGAIFRPPGLARFIHNVWQIAPIRFFLVNLQKLPQKQSVNVAAGFSLRLVCLNNSANFPG
jgi:hypothetical protein